jgi:N-acetylmuramoyl-L-alanine amidase
MRRTLLLVLTLILALSVINVLPAAAQTGANMTVSTANHLNVRNAPTTAAGVVAVIARGYSYPVIGRTFDASWWQIQMRPTGLVGWVSGAYIQVTNAHLVPAVTPPPAAGASFATGTVNTGRLNVRNIPDPNFGAVLTRISQQDVVQLLGKTASAPVWFNVALPDGTNGWVNGRYLIIANSGLVPVTWTTPTTPIPPTPAPVSAYGTVTAYFLNVRTTPNPYIYNIIATIARNQTYSVIGKNAAGTWWQLVLPSGATGWVNGRYLSVANGHLVPITFY